jgi:2-oxoglutarate ferredoxin oxidoreductase subunit alpha
MFDFTIMAFNLSETYRLPVLVMADEVVGHMNERVVIPEAEEIEIVNRKKPTDSPDTHLPYQAGADGIAPMACAGDGYHVHITGLTHDDRGYPGMDAATQKHMMERLIGKIKNNVDQIISVDMQMMDDAEVAVVAYGISARAAKRSVMEARAKGIKAGLVKLNTVWPFPEKLIEEIAGRVKAMVMPEINLGQMVLELERCSRGRCLVKLVGHAGGAIHSPRTVLAEIESALKEA